MVAAMEKEEELCIKLARLQQEFALYKEDSVDAQQHSVVTAKFKKAQEMLMQEQETSRLLRQLQLHVQNIAHQR